VGGAFCRNEELLPLSSRVLENDNSARREDDRAENGAPRRRERNNSYFAALQLRERRGDGKIEQTPYTTSVLSPITGTAMENEEKERRSAIVARQEKGAVVDWEQRLGLWAAVLK